jgi:hypothetical protein
MTPAVCMNDSTLELSKPGSDDAGSEQGGGRYITELRPADSLSNAVISPTKGSYQPNRAKMAPPRLAG